MADWGICSTVQAPTDQVLAFVAHHLSIGASHIWLFFDDPSDPAFDAVAGIAHVSATRCDQTYWQSVCKTRPDTHQNRQSRNMRRVYNAAALQWTAHIDVDEFLLPSRPVSAILAELPADRIIQRVAPWEALHSAGLPDDIFTARQFRASLKGDMLSDARSVAFGRYADFLDDGVLSHSAGKCFFQRGFTGLQPRLHGAFRDAKRVTGGSFHPEIALLHFHAEDPDRWKQRLQFRLTKGAYQFNPALQSYLLTASPDEIAAFYTAVQQPDEGARSYLASNHLMLETNLNLRGKVDALLSNRPYIQDRT